MEQRTTYHNHELLVRIAEGDEKAFRIFFDKYRNRFYAVVLKMTRSEALAEDMVQEIFLKIWQNRASLPEITNPDSYFFTSLYRQVFRHYKRAALDRNLLKMVAEAPSFQSITDETVLAREGERLIEEAISRLPAQQQQVFRLSKQDGFSREQIAEQLNISPHTVKNHLADAMKSVKSYLSHSILIYIMLASLLD
ncbi:RNA polymerase sigma-70 factor, ECF subfamily [Chitinophaga sp. 180180018-2]|nr:RNA polymerase sigma-70 factor, ECF subfamily [Chitinophaga sp. 212800010-3]